MEDAFSEGRSCRSWIHRLLLQKNLLSHPAQRVRRIPALKPARLLLLIPRQPFETAIEIFKPTPSHHFLFSQMRRCTQHAPRSSFFQSAPFLALQ